MKSRSTHCVEGGVVCLEGAKCRGVALLEKFGRISAAVQPLQNPLREGRGAEKSKSSKFTPFIYLANKYIPSFSLRWEEGI